jgi:aspartyl-tRNA(Asn)/glutamyl-tRNA(Gln) amidotransferase subunit A
MNLKDYTIQDLASGLRAKKFSAKDLADSAFEAIEKQDKDLNAFITLNKDQAYEAAEETDKKLASGEDLPLLAGIPVGVKDLFCTRGLRTTCASNILKDFVPPYDATAVLRLRDRGMTLIGKTNLDEFACGASTEHSAFGVVKNPLDLTKVAGGSSGGSAACVAAGMTTYSLGTDTGGSIRQPAAFCGIVGVKPTYGRVSRSGVSAMASSWDHIGPMANTVEDAAIVLKAIAGHDKADSTTPKVEVPDYLEFLKQDVKGLKIGLPKEYFGEGVSEEVTEKVQELCKKLEGAGAHVKEVSLPTTEYAVAVYYVTMPAELSTNLERYDGIRYGSKSKDAKTLFETFAKTRGEGFGTEIKRRILIGTYVLSAGYFDAYYNKAQQVRTLIIQDFERVFTEVDVLIAPTAPTTAFGIGELVNDPLAMYMADALTIPANAAGVPAISLNAGNGKDSGLPVGVQVIAPQFAEGLCFRAAKAIEDLV